VATNDAFADHWGSTPRDRAAWEHDIATHGSRPDLSFLALDDDRVVGVCRNGHFPGDEAVNGRRDGWIMQLSVVRSHRRRGVASALIAASLHAFKGAGFTHSALGVDSENPTGANQVYERLGYRTIHRSVTCQRTV
jgi:ribosomal protein S18 acetylase RimI-like enzyme